MLRSLASSSLAFVFGVFVVAGCSSEDGAGAPKEGEIGSAGTGICGAASTWKDSCASGPTACDETIVGTCSDVTSLLNASILDGAKSCLEEDACNVSPTKCLAKSVASAKMSDAHKNLAKGFCGCLLTGESACVEAIDEDDGPARAALAIALPLSDELANAITESCTTMPGCAATFSACAQGVVTQKIAEKLSVEAAGCVAKSILSTAKDAANGSGGDASDPSCTAKTCEDYGGECGTHDNGCGGTINCGECTSACAARTCAQLGKTCGTHPDGCGGTVNCGLCPTTGCTADAKEPNDSTGAAADLGAATDAPNTTKAVTALSASDGDEDWFKLRVSDSGFGGNPRIDASTTDTSLEITVFHVCDSLPNYSSCTDKGSQDNTVGFGCRGAAGGKSSLSTDCKGIDETGTTYVRVRKLASDGKCNGYSLTVDVY